MPQPSNSPIRIQIGLRGWAAITAVLAILFAAAVAIAFLAIGFVVFVLPAMLLAPLFYYFMPKPKPIFHPVSDTAEHDLARPTIIDGTFRAMDSNSFDEKSDTSGQG